MVAIPRQTGTSAAVLKAHNLVTDKGKRNGTTDQWDREPAIRLSPTDAPTRSVSRAKRSRTPSNHPSHPQTLRRTIRSPISKFITYLKASPITGIKHLNLLKAMMNQSWSSCRHGRIAQTSSIFHQPSAIFCHLPSSISHRSAIFCLQPSAFSPQPLALSLHPSSIIHLPSSIFRMQPISQNM